MDKYSKPHTPVAKTRSWRASNCSCSHFDLFEGLELRNLVVCTYKACVNSKSCPIYIHSTAPVENTKYNKHIFIANDPQEDISVDIESKRKLQNNQNYEIDEREVCGDEKHYNQLENKTSRVKENANHKTDNILNNISENATHHDIATKICFNKHLEEEILQNTYPEIQAQVIFSHKDYSKEDHKIATHSNNATFGNLKYKGFDAIFTEKNIEYRTKNSKSQSPVLSKIVSKNQEIWTSESKETNMFHKDSLSLIRNSESLGEKKTKRMSYMDPDNQENVYFKIRQLNSNKIISETTKKDNTIKVCKSCNNGSLESLSQKINKYKHEHTYASPTHEKGIETAIGSKPLDHKINKDEFNPTDYYLKPTQNYKITNHSNPQHSQNYAIINHSEWLFKEDGLNAHQKYRKIFNHGKPLPKEQIEDQLHHTCPVHTKNLQIPKLNSCRSEGQATKKRRHLINSCSEDGYKCNNNDNPFQFNINTHLREYKTFCPVYYPCPSCRKVFIEEQNNECDECRKTKHRILPKEQKQKNYPPKAQTLLDKGVIYTCAEKEYVCPAADQDSIQNTKNKIAAECTVPESYDCIFEDIKHDSVSYNSLFKARKSTTKHQEHRYDNRKLLRLDNNFDLTTYIKDCIHKELLEIKHSLALAVNKINDVNSSSFQEIQTHVKPVNNTNQPTIHKKIQSKNINHCFLDRNKIKNVKYGKPAYKENLVHLKKYSDLIYKKCNFLGQKENIIPDEIDDQTNNTRWKNYFDLKRNKKECSTKECIMQTNICEIDPEFSKEKINKSKSVDNQRTFRSKYNKSSAFVTNVTATSKSYRTSTDELTAQIMNVPYKLFKQIAHSEIKPLCLTGLLQKIHKFYDACSCKMCECINSNPTVTNTEICNCTPCDCSQCSTKDVYLFSKCKNWMDNANNNNVHQKIKDCITSKMDYLQKSCGCKPCECMECKSNGLNFGRLNKQNNFIVARIRDDQERPYCQCSPCGCFDCAHPYGTAAPTHYSQETGTATDDRRHVNCNCNDCVNDNCEQEGIDTCTCDKYSKLMSKPVTNDKKDFDIHYVVNKSNMMKTLLHPFDKKWDAVSIYTSLIHQIFCPFKARPIVDGSLNEADNLKYSSTDWSRVVSKLHQDSWANTAMMINSLRCNCKPCQCQKCKEHFLDGHIPYCEICECINSASLNVSYDFERKYSKKRNKLPNQKCYCKPCECFDCIKYDESRLYDNDYTFLDENNPLNDDTLLRATDSELYIDQILTDKGTKNRCLFNDHCNTSRLQTFLNHDDVQLYRTNVQNNNEYFYRQHHLDTSPGFDTHNNNKIKYRTDRVEHDFKMYNNKKHSRKTLKINTSKNNFHVSNQIIRFNSTVISGAPFLGTTQDISKFSEQSKFSTDSSCNDFDHDYLSYALHEPTSTIEACIEDVMNLQLCNKSSTYNSKPNVKPRSNIEVKWESTTNNINNNKLSFLDLNVMDTNGIVQFHDNTKIYDNVNNDKSIQCKLICGCTDRLSGSNEILCHNENTIIKRQNESTQTTIFTLNVENNVSEKISLLLKKWNVSFCDNDEIIRWTDIPTQNYLSKNMTEYSSIYYDSVRRTIQEAKQYSLQLLNMLHKYEKANKDLDQLTIRYKKIQEPVLDQVVERKNFDQPTFIEGSSNDQSISDIRDNKLNDLNKLEVDSRHSLTTNLKPVANESNTTGNINEAVTLREANIKEKMDTIEPIPKNAVIIQSIIEQEDNICQIDHNSPAKTNKLPMQLSKCKDKFKFEKLILSFKEYSQHLDKVLNRCRQNVCEVTAPSIISKPVSSQKESTPQNKIKEIPKKCEIPIQNGKKIDKDSSGLNTVFICNSLKDRMDKELRFNTANYQNMDSLAVSTKLGTCDGVIKSFKANQHTHMSHMSHDVQSQARIETAASMSSKKLSDWVARSIANTSIYSDLTSNSSRNPKVVFHTVRVLPDHSILLKWNIPDDTTSIEGYEVLVDGRPVQRIMCPSKNIAVLSCLPHSDKLKLTVRILTKPDQTGSADFIPSATVVISTRP